MKNIFIKKEEEKVFQKGSIITICLTTDNSIHTWSSKLLETNMSGSKLHEWLQDYRKEFRMDAVITHLSII